MAADGKEIECAREYTFAGYTDESAVKFVILVTALMYEADNSMVPMLDPRITRFGMSNKAHPQTVNTIQLLFLPDGQNKMM